MKINNSKNKKKIVVTTSVVLVLILAGIGYVFANNVFNTNPQSGPTTNLNPATDEEKKEGDSTKSSTIESEDTSSESTKNEDSTNQPSTPSTVSVQTSASAQNGTTYQLRYLIEAVVNDATCTLTLKNGSTMVTKTSKTQALAQSSTCQGFDISTSELRPGTWEASLVVNGNNLTGSTSSTIRVQ